MRKRHELRTTKIAGSESQIKDRWLKIILLIVITFIAYSSAIRGGFIWDDPRYVTENKLLTSPKGLWKIWTTIETIQYYPLVFTSFWIERHLWGLNPLGYHVVNVILHSVSVVLIWTILLRLKVKYAWLIAAIFAVHPVHVESVAWITELKNTLSGFFYLFALNTYLKFEEDRKPYSYCLSISLFFCALLSKTVTATLPITLLILRWMRRRSLNKEYLLRLIPFFIMGFGMGQLTALYEKYNVLAVGPEWDLTISQRIIIAGRNIWFYVAKLIYPANLSFTYPRWQLNPQELWQWFPTIGVVVFIVLLWALRKKLGRSPLAAFVYFIVTLFPALGFFNVYPMRFSFVADHFQYLASLGIITLVVGSGSNVIDMMYHSHLLRSFVSYRQFKRAIAFLIIMTLGILTWKRGHIFQNEENLWKDVIAKNPTAWIAYNNLNVIYYNRKEYDKAKELVEKAIELKPEYAEHYFNYGNIFYVYKDYDKAEELYKKAILLKSDLAHPHFYLGNIYTMRKDYKKALKEYKIALRILPHSQKVQAKVELLRKLVLER